ncbi:MAG: DUF1329 domain-containing protein [Candidatus Binataceae bacterium]
MSRIRNVLCGVLAVVVAWSMTGIARAATSDTIPPGTTINMSNWQKYKQFMPDGMQVLFEGQHHWKMPADVEMDVGPTVIYKLPKPFESAVEKYGHQTKLVKQPDGEYKLENYVAGVPFPNPAGPNKGTEIAADVTYRPGGMLYVGMPNSGVVSSFCGVDRFGNQSCERVDYVYRQLAYNWFPGVPHANPQAAGAWYTEWLMVEAPQESKYTADLTIYWQNNLQLEANYVFVPSLRRTLRLSASARCAPLFGSDMTHDDQRVGWNGGVGMFHGTFLRNQNILALIDLTTADGAFPQNYDMPLGWAKPSWGKWEVIPVWVTDVQRIPSMAKGYCYGKRIMYTSRNYYANVHEDLYDTNDKLWKVVNIGLRPRTDHEHPEWGKQYFGGGIIEQYWDVQNAHASQVFTAFDGKDLWADHYSPQYNNVSRYSTPGGLMQIMK